MLQYQLYMNSAKLISALISLNDVQSRELRWPKYMANVMGISFSVCKWHALYLNTLFPAHIVIPAVSDIGIWKYLYCLCYVFVMVNSYF